MENIPEVSLIENIYNNNKKHLGKVAINYMDKKITYDEFFRNVYFTAEAFKNIGVNKGDIVTIMPINTPEFLYTYYGLNLIGAIANSIHPLSSKRDIKNYLKETPQKYVVCSDTNCKNLNEALSDYNEEGKNIKGIIAPFSNSIAFGTQLKSLRNKELVKKSMQLNKDVKSALLTGNFITWNNFIRKGYNFKNKFGKYNLNFKGKFDDVALIVHTGGTTGVPKGVLLTNKNGVSLAQYHFETKELTELLTDDTTILGNISMYTAFGFLDNLNVPLTLGVGIELEPVYSVSAFVNDICKKKPNIIFTVPSFLEEFKSNIEKLEYNNENSKIDLSHIDVIIVGGQKVSRKSLEELDTFFAERQKLKKDKVKVNTGYGSSETSAAATCTIFKNCDRTKVGKPFNHVNISIIDLETKQKLPCGEVGEVVISGPTVMSGYYNMPNETKEVLYKDDDNNMCYHTGDIGFINKSGELDVIGRIRKMITMYNGHKIASTAIEDMVESLDIIDKCVIVPMKDPFHAKGEVPKAYVSLNEDCSIEDITKKVKNVVSENMNERNNIYDVIIVDNIPQTKMGKKDFKAIEILDLLNSIDNRIHCSINCSENPEYDYLCEIENSSNVDNEILLEKLKKLVDQKEKSEGVKIEKRKNIEYIFTRPLITTNKRKVMSKY